MAEHADRLILAGGRESTTFMSYQPNTVLAEKLGKRVVDLPGGHTGMVTSPIDFARGLVAVLGHSNFRNG